MNRENDGPGALLLDLPTESVRILLCEDNPNDVELTKAALQEVKLDVVMDHVANGEEALHFLRRGPGYEDAQRPDLILLDLNMPRMTGREVLAEMKIDPKLQTIPVVVLTTSKSEEDLLCAYDLHASCYIVKPLDFHAFVEVVKSIEEFWFTVVALPPKNP